ncbi:MAG: hypothetical protein GY909_01600 [Oligoflexia bacterium]|nr:hypothetical protein [Oligoflexia bacterium]
MEVAIHNYSEINYRKVRDAILFQIKNKMERLKNSGKWKIEFWIADKNDPNLEYIDCAIAIKRPKRRTLYIKQSAGNLKTSIKRCLKEIEQKLKIEKTKQGVR